MPTIGGTLRAATRSLAGVLVDDDQVVPLRFSFVSSAAGALDPVGTPHNLP